MVYDVIAVIVLMLIVWIWVVLFLVPFVHPLSYIIIGFPFLAMVLDLANIKSSNSETERAMFQNDGINILLVVIGLFIGAKVMSGAMDKRFTNWIILAIFFVMLSTSDVWVSGRHIKALKYFRSICDIFSMTIFLVLMLEYFSTERK